MILGGVIVQSLFCFESLVTNLTIERCCTEVGLHVDIQIPPSTKTLVTTDTFMTLDLQVYVSAVLFEIVLVLEGTWTNFALVWPGFTVRVLMPLPGILTSKALATDRADKGPFPLVPPHVGLQSGSVGKFLRAEVTRVHLIYLCDAHGFC